MKQITLKLEKAIVRARVWLHGKSTHDALQADISDGCKADLIKAKHFIAAGKKKKKDIRYQDIQRFYFWTITFYWVGLG